MKRMIRLACIDADNARALAYLLTYDHELMSALGTNKEGKILQSEEFLKTTLEWQRRTHSRSYAILLNDKAIGLISLSHMDGTTARIGYWLSSSYWNKGYMTQAFSMALEQASKLGLKTIKATIDPKNTASIKIWENRGACITKRGNQREATLSILLQ